MYGRRRSLLLGLPLLFLSLLYGFAVLLRLGLYKIGFFRQKRLPKPVIAVGNITLGGTGKTPTVMQIASVLLRQGKHPVVISRGYGRADESAILIVSDGDRVLATARAGGDEPVLMASRLAGVPVVVGSNRFNAGLLAHKKFNNDAVILDDAFQHRGLHRDLDIVLVDAADPFGSGRLFPAGILREPLSGLSRAHAVLITNIDRSNDPEALKKKIGQYTKARIFTSRQVPSGLVNITSGESRGLSVLQHANVLAFAGIARPVSFVSMLRSLGAAVKAEFAYPDHYQYKESDLVRIFEESASRHVNLIVTTEKDAVRLKSLNPEGIWALRIELSVIEKEEWEGILLNKT
jgi:tetraacyldisaccharide 4'-kinase